MINSFVIKMDNIEIPYRLLQFSGGELHVILDFSPYKFELEKRMENGDFTECQSIIIDSLHYPAHYTMELSLIVDALHCSYKLDRVPVNLGMTYIPYARQDRCTAEGNAFSLKAFAKQINALGFSNVFVTDPHSDVATALIDNCIVTSLLDVFILNSRLLDNCTHLVSPDAGAYKKTQSVAGYFGKEVITALKTRDTSTGKLSGTKVIPSDSTPLSIVVTDDICDGGGTFLALGQELRKMYPSIEINLYVTHGIFSKGTEDLLKLYNNIYCHNLMNIVEGVQEV